MSNTRSGKGRRTMTWDHPVLDAESAFAMRGLDLINAMKEGRIPPPPVWSLINFRLMEIEEGRVVLQLTPAEYHYNRFGMVQGGIECAILDAGAGYAVHSTLAAGTGYTSLDLKVNYLRPISAETGPVSCVGRIMHKGSRIAVAEADIIDSNGQVYAHALSMCLLFKMKGVKP